MFRALAYAYAAAVLVFLACTPAVGQSLSVGKGEYSLTLPSGAVGPQNFNGQNILPKVSGGFDLRVQTNDFWSSLIFPFFGDPYSNVLYAHPLNVKAVAGGLQIGYTPDHIFAANDFLYPFADQITVGVDGLNATRAVADSYGDWTATALWDDGSLEMKATFGHGLPFVFFHIEGGDALVTASAQTNVWLNDNEVFGLTVDGRHFMLFAPSGATWTGSNPFRSTLNGKDFLAVALLPDTDPSTVALFRSHAYAFVVDSRVDWEYDEAASSVTTTFSYETVLMDSAATNVDETLTALYRHQWLHTDAVLTGLTYQSPNGVMRLHAGSTFQTEHPFAGVLPALPDRGDYNRDQLLAMVQEAASAPLPDGPTYENGKAIGRFSNLVHIADQLGAVAERDHFLSEIKRRLEEWFTVGGGEEYSYNAAWDVLTGYPSGFGADREINDHHFHASYAVMSAATVAQYDSAWASQDNWGGMVNLLISDANNWDRTDDRFPFLRSHDAYAGHSWAAGHGDFGDGNNQESSSESMNFASAVVLWGEATGQPAIRDLGVFLHATETAAVEQYWFDVDDVVFPADYPHVAIGMVWGGKGVHSTWFGANPEFIHGINILPLTGGSLYLGRHPDFVIANYDEIVAERGGQPIVWKDILWQYLSLADPDRALSYYFADENYEPFDGESRAHTLHWLYNLKKMGRVATTITADVPTYAVFETPGGDLTYVAHNAAPAPRDVLFSDGFSMRVEPRSMAWHSTAVENPDAPVVLLQADRTSGKVPLTVSFTGSRSFDRNGGDISYLWSFGSTGTSASADTVYTFTEVGEHWARLTVTDDQSLSSADSILVTVVENGTPYFGTPAQVPGRIEAEHYDIGGEGRAYHDTEAANIGMAFRPAEGVDLEASNDQGFDVYWIVAGEWIEYTFAVDTPGEYDFRPYVASVPGMGSFRMLIDGEDVSGTRPVASTGGWQFWRAVPVEDVTLDQGTHILRFEFDSVNDKTGWLFSLNYIEVARSTQVATEDEGAPVEFALRQNYPNPVRTRSTIEFAVAESGAAHLALYNTLGQEVAVLIDDFRTAGRHAVNLDAGSLASGVYFYTLKTPTFARTRPLLVVR